MSKKISTTSKNIQNENLDKLRRVFPQFVKDNEIDFDALKKFFDKENILSDEKEKYGLNWAGKSNAFKLIRTPATGTLTPDEKESKDFENTENVFIEGDNLEVLKLLQKHYREKIKMIYIDPPYNTGKDFIYKDNFKESISDYYERTGQSKNGIKLTSNPESAGRYHSDWLTMMYPRLFLARNLLKNDGVIFISIDDNEVANLRLIMDEIFGEENFVEQFIWKKKGGSGNTENYIGDIVEYIIMYAKNKESSLALNRRKINNRDYPFKDENGYYRLQGLLKTDQGTYQRNTMKFGIKSPKNKKNIYPPKGKRWIIGENKKNELLMQGLLLFVANKDGKIEVKKKEYSYDNDIKTGVYLNLLLEKGSLKNAKTELENLNFNRECFDTPKPTILIKHLCNIATKRNDLILDFFAGSGTTAHAVMDLNAEDGGNRKWICAQLPEEVDENSEAKKAGFNNIAEIARERIRRAGDKITKDKKEELKKRENRFDTGFKTCKLEKSNYRQWNTITVEDDEQKLLDQVKLFTEKPLIDKYDEKFVVYEILIKEGFNLNAKIENKKEGDLKIWKAQDEDKTIIITFNKKITQEQVEKLGLKKDDTFVCLDSALDDSTKINLDRNLVVKII
jgi:adenine-specific DNA-methyltransferase